jgi:hypothetical protein
MACIAEMMWIVENRHTKDWKDGVGGVTNWHMAVDVLEDT